MTKREKSIREIIAMWGELNAKNKMLFETELAKIKKEQNSVISCAAIPGTAMQQARQ